VGEIVGGIESRDSVLVTLWERGAAVYFGRDGRG
jgi:hypothetical protein